MSKRKKQTKIDLDTLQVLLLVFIIIFIVYVLFFISNMESLSKDRVVLTYDEAISLNNISNCDLIQKKELIEVCKVKLSDCQDDECKFKKARLEMDTQACYNITDENLRAGCTASIKRSKLLESAVLEDNISLCLNFEDESGIERCRDNYYIAKRFNENNKEFCSYIVNEKIKDECLK